MDTFLFAKRQLRCLCTPEIEELRTASGFLARLWRVTRNLRFLVAYRT